MGYLKNKTFGFYLSFVAAILALIGFVMYLILSGQAFCLLQMQF